MRAPPRVMKQISIGNVGGLQATKARGERVGILYGDGVGPDGPLVAEVEEQPSLVRSGLPPAAGTLRHVAAILATERSQPRGVGLESSGRRRPRAVDARRGDSRRGRADMRVGGRQRPRTGIPLQGAGCYRQAVRRMKGGVRR